MKILNIPSKENIECILQLTTFTYPCRNNGKKFISSITQREYKKIVAYLKKIEIPNEKTNQTNVEKHFKIHRAYVSTTATKEEKEFIQQVLKVLQVWLIRKTGIYVYFQSDQQFCNYFNHLMEDMLYHSLATKQVILIDHINHIIQQIRSFIKVNPYALAYDWISIDFDTGFQFKRQNKEEPEISVESPYIANKSYQKKNYWQK